MNIIKYLFFITAIIDTFIFIYIRQNLIKLLSVKELKDGDAFYFKKVFDQYHQKLYFFILYKTKSDYIAEEVVQMAFTKLWQCRKTLQEEYTISTQLYRMATTILIDFLRKYNHKDALTARLDRKSVV